MYLLLIPVFWMLEMVGYIKLCILTQFSSYSNRKIQNLSKDGKTLIQNFSKNINAKKIKTISIKQTALSMN